MIAAIIRLRVLREIQWMGFLFESLEVRCALMPSSRRRTAGAPPLALAVITATGYALTRPDGVLQFPIGALTV